MRADGWSTKKEHELSGVPPESTVRKKARDLISKAAAEEQRYDRTATPASIAGLGEAASAARLRGALADLSYNQDRLRRLEDEPLVSTGSRRFSPSLGTLGRWLDQPRQSERYAAAQKIQRLQNKLPDLDYLSWADRGMPRPETYTAENLADYAPRIGQLANYPGKPTKAMQREAKEILRSTQADGITGSAGGIQNFTPYTNAVSAGDTVLANEKLRQFSRLSSIAHGAQSALSYGLFDGSGLLSLEKAWAKLLGEEEIANGLQLTEEGMQAAAAAHPELYRTTQYIGSTALLAMLGASNGAGLRTLGMGGPLAQVLRGALTLGGSTALHELDDFTTGKITPEQYWSNVEKSIRAGGAWSGLMELLPTAKEWFFDRFSRRNAGSPASGPAPAAGPPANTGLTEVAKRDVITITGALQARGMGARDAVLTALQLADIKQNAGQTALLTAEKEFDAQFERGYNESEDYEEWEHFANTLGKDAQESFQEFQKIKYDDPEGYADLEGFYQYKTQNPGSGKAFYEAEKVHAQLLEAGEIRATGVIVTPKQNINIISPNEHATERLIERGITLEEARSFVDNAVFALKQWNGGLYTFYSEYGFASVDTNGILRTAGYLDGAGMKLFGKVVKELERNP